MSESMLSHAFCMNLHSMKSFVDLTIACYILGRRTINRGNVSSFSPLLSQTTC